MRGQKFRSGFQCLRQRQFSHNHGHASRTQQNTLSSTGTTTTAPRSNKTSAMRGATQKASSSSPGPRSANAAQHSLVVRQSFKRLGHPQKAQASRTMKQEASNSILLRSFNSRLKESSSSNGGGMATEKQLAQMQPLNFMQPTQGVGVGVQKQRGGGAEQTQNFLQARIFARNLGIEGVHLGHQPLPRTVPMTHSHSRFQTTNAPPSVLDYEPQECGSCPRLAHMKSDLQCGRQIHSDEDDFQADYHNPAVQGHRLEMKQMDRVRQQPYQSSKLLFKAKRESRPAAAAGAAQQNHNSCKQISLPPEKPITPSELKLVNKQTIHLGVQQSAPTSPILDPSQLQMASMTLNEMTLQKQLVTGQTMSPKESSTDQEPILSPKSPSFSASKGREHALAKAQNKKALQDSEVVVPLKDATEAIGAFQKRRQEMGTVQGPHTPGFSGQAETQMSQVENQALLQQSISQFGHRNLGFNNAQAQVQGQFTAMSQAQQSKSKKTISVYNQTPGVDEAQLAAKYTSQLSNSGSAIGLNGLRNQYADHQTPREVHPSHEQQCGAPPSGSTVKVAESPGQYETVSPLQMRRPSPIGQAEQSQMSPISVKDESELKPLQLINHREVVPSKPKLNDQISARRAIFTSESNDGHRNHVYGFQDVLGHETAQKRLASAKVLLPPHGGGPDQRPSAANMLANIEGNVNISAILVQAKRDGNQAGIVLPQGETAINDFAQEIQPLTTKERRMVPGVESQPLFQGYEDPFFMGRKRDSIGLINFNKPVNKLVSNVAKAIGESVRRMQPRSLQRSAYDRKRSAEISRQQAAETQTRLLRQSKSAVAQKTRPAARKRAQQAAGVTRNNLIEKITKITMLSHGEITENQNLKQNLEQLAVETRLSNQIQSRAAFHATTQIHSSKSTGKYLCSMAPSRIAPYAMPQTNILIQNETNGQKSQPVTYDREPPSQMPSQLTPIKDQGSASHNSVTPNKQLSSKYPAFDRLLTFEDPQNQITVSVMPEIADGRNKPHTATRSRNNARSRQTDSSANKFAQTGTVGFLNVSRKPILAVSPSPARMSAKSGSVTRGESQSPPPLPLPAQVSVQQQSDIKGTNWLQKAAQNSTQKQDKGTRGSIRDLNRNSQVEFKAIDSVLITYEGLARSSDVECSTAREFHFKDNDHGVDSPVDLYTNTRNKKKLVMTNDGAITGSKRPLAHNESYPTTIYTEMGYHAGNTTPSKSREETIQIQATKLSRARMTGFTESIHTKEGVANPKLTSSSMVLLEGAASANQLANQYQAASSFSKQQIFASDPSTRESHQGHIRIAKQNITPQVRVFSESAMAPVYDDVRVHEARMADYLLSTSSQQKADFVANKAVGVQSQFTSQTLLVLSSETDQKSQIATFTDGKKPSTATNSAKLGFAGLLIQSQEGRARPQQAEARSQLRVQDLNILRSQSPQKPPSGVSKYATTQPNRWLHDAIRRGKKLRQQNRQRTCLLSQSMPFSTPANGSEASSVIEPGKIAGNETVPQLQIGGNKDALKLSVHNINANYYVEPPSSRRSQFRPGAAPHSTQNRHRFRSQGTGSNTSQLKAQGTQIQAPVSPSEYEKIIMVKGSSTQVSGRELASFESRPSPPAEHTLLDQTLIKEFRSSKAVSENESFKDPKLSGKAPNEVQRATRAASPLANVCTAGLPTEADQPTKAAIGEEVEEAQLMLEMQNMQDYHSQLPQLGSSHNVSLAHSDNSIQKQYVKKPSQPKVEFKVLPSTIHSLNQRVLAPPSCSDKQQTKQVKSTYHILRDQAAGAQSKVSSCYKLPIKVTNEAVGLGRPQCASQQRLREGKSDPSIQIAVACQSTKTEDGKRELRVQGERFGANSTQGIYSHAGSQVAVQRSSKKRQVVQIAAKERPSDLIPTPYCNTKLRRSSAAAAGVKAEQRQLRTFSHVQKQSQLQQQLGNTIDDHALDIQPGMILMQQNQFEDQTRKISTEYSQ